MTISVTIKHNSAAMTQSLFVETCTPGVQSKNDMITIIRSEILPGKEETFTVWGDQFLKITESEPATITDGKV